MPRHGCQAELPAAQEPTEEPRIRARAWRARPKASTAAASGPRPGGSPARDRFTGRGAGDAEGGGSGSGGGNPAAEQHVGGVGELKVGGTTVTAAQAQLYGLKLSDLARRFDGSTGGGRPAGGRGTGGQRQQQQQQQQQQRRRGGWGGGQGRGREREGVVRVGGERGSSFGSLDDARHCIFQPRGKSPARLAAARAAGFAGAGARPPDEDAGRGGVFRRPGEGPTAKDLEVRTEVGGARGSRARWRGGGGGGWVLEKRAGVGPTGAGGWFPPAGVRF